MYSIWEMPDTKVSLWLSGDNYEIRHFIEYDSNALQHLEDEAQQQRTLKDL
jgi:hypothetical protein